MVSGRRRRERAALQELDRDVERRGARYRISGNQRRHRPGDLLEDRQQYRKK
jgi:hypothetical protein